MFTLSGVNAVLNAMVIGVFMDSEVIVLYNIAGTAAFYGSKWWYLLFAAIPLLISGSLLAFERMKSKNEKKSDPEENNGTNENSAECDAEDTTNALDEILTGNTPHSDNIGMIFTWFFAVISWVMTGIALNNIENISIILPSIIVIMLSAAMIFITGLYSSSLSASVCGIKLKWLENNEKLSKKSNRFTMYMGMLSGMAGVCLAAWSLELKSICFAPSSRGKVSHCMRSQSLHSS